MRKKLTTIVTENDGYPFAKISQRAFDWAVEQYQDSCHYTDSPIEAILLTALIVNAKVSGRLHSSVDVWDEQEPSFLAASQREFEIIAVNCQVVIIEEWPVDFVVTVSDRSDKTHRLVIECDGHDFHERTKAQAKRDRSRDRSLQELGYTIFRFTGSEIWNDPNSCAFQIMNWAENAYFERLK